MLPEPSATPRRLGVLFDRDRSPEELADFARAVDATSTDDLWVVEDLGWAGGIAASAIALSASRRVRVGLGIAPAPLRNPMLLAMELGTLARVFPDRFVAGVGHGVPQWMRQVGAGTPHKLALLGETIEAVRDLLRGQTVTVHGTAVHLDGVRLVHPPAGAPPVVAGVVGPRSLELAGRVADGTVVAEGHGPADLPAVLANVQRGRAGAGDRTGHEVVVFSYLCVGDDPAAVRAALGPLVAEQAQWLGVAPDEVFRIAGPADEAATAVRALWSAGADTVVLRPVGADPLGQLQRTLAALGR